MGLFDLPAPVLSWFDAWIAAFLPPGSRIALWGILGAGISMGLYWAISPQARFARIASEESLLKRKLNDASDDMAEGLTHAKHLLRLAVTRLALVLPSAGAAIVPVLCLIVWLQAYYAYDFPAPGESVEVRVEPAGRMEGRLVATGSAVHIDIIDRQEGAVVQSFSVAAPVPRMETRSWRNTLVGNPSGYLPKDSPAERVELSLPRKEYLPVGPDWLRGWEAIFLATMLVGSLLMKFMFRIR